MQNQDNNISEQTVRNILQNHLQQLQIQSFSEVNINQLIGGQINYVYQIENKYVIKIQRYQDILNYQAYIMQLAYNNHVKIPRVYATGFYQASNEMENNISQDKQRNNYIIMQKVEGRNLSQIYDQYYNSVFKKQLIIKQLCQQMKKLHQIKFNKYWIEGKQFQKCTQALDNLKLFSCIEDKKQMYRHHFTGQNQKYYQIVIKLRDFYNQNKSVLDQQGQFPVLVHNDLHFCNLLAKQNGELTAIIDFDFSRKTHADYQLFRILAFFLKPEYYVQQNLEQIWKGRNFKQEASLIQKYYPELFQSKNLLIKIKIYFIEQIMNDIQSQCFDAVQCWYQSIFISSWLQKLLNL